MPGGIGLFGGTFDPIHLAHLRVAEELREAEALDEVRFVPAASPPHKQGAPITPAGHRVRMIELAIAGTPGFRVWPIELGRAGPSYTVDTLEALRRELGTASRIVLAMGLDQFAELHTWRAPEAILAACDVVVLTRPPAPKPLNLAGFPVVSLGGLCYDPPSDRYVHGSGHWVRLLAVTPLDIAATTIRAAVRTGRSIRFVVPPVVETYLRTHRLYREDSDS